METRLDQLMTEARNPDTLHIDTVDSEGVLRLINAEDRKVADIVAEQIPVIAQAVDRIVDSMQKGGRLIYAGAGTSGRIALLDAAESPPTFGTDPELVQALIAGGQDALLQAIEGAEDDADQGAKDLRALNVRDVDVVVGIAASGRTPYVIGVMQAAKDVGATTMCVVCNDNSPVQKLADVAMKFLVGPEVITGSTRMKAGTAQKLALNMLSTATMVRLGKVYSNLMINMQPTNEKLLQRAVRIVRQATGVDESTAKALLERSDGRIDVALVMHEASVDAEEALAALARHGGRARDAIEGLSE